MFTHDELIQIRQSEIFNEVQNIDDRIQQLRIELEKLDALKKRRIAEHDLLQRVKDKGLVDNDRRTTRLDFESAVRNIFDSAGRPLMIGEVISRLEEFGFIWSTYQSAYGRLRALDVLQPTGARGYYNFIP